MGAQATEKRDPSHMPGGATVRPESGSVCLSWDTGSGGGQLLGNPGRFFFLRWDCVCLRVLSPPLCARDSASSLSWQALLLLPYKPGCVTTQSPRPILGEQIHILRKRRRRRQTLLLLWPPPQGRSSPHGRQMPHDHVQGLDRLEGDAGQPPRKCIV